MAVLISPNANKKQCTQSKNGRKIKCYPEYKQRDEPRLHMATPEPKKILSQRKSMVELVFLALRGIQSFERFQRNGLLDVKREFTLHAIAYNLSRAVDMILWIILVYYLYKLKSEKEKICTVGFVEKNPPPFVTASERRGYKARFSG